MTRILSPARMSKSFKLASAILATAILSSATAYAMSMDSGKLPATSAATLVGAAAISQFYTLKAIYDNNVANKLVQTIVYRRVTRHDRMGAEIVEEVILSANIACTRSVASGDIRCAIQGD